MLAMLCSKLEATRAMMGKTMARILSTTLRGSFRGVTYFTKARASVRTSNRISRTPVKISIMQWGSFLHTQAATGAAITPLTSNATTMSQRKASSPMVRAKVIV